MPSGDAQRAWFPEMLSHLAKNWNDKISWEDYCHICKEMTEYRKELREQKNIGKVKKFCKNCNQYHEMGPPPIGIRSLLFALKKSNIINDSKFTILEKEWKKYQRKNNLDGYGNLKLEKSQK
jgi:hypothetical protein